MRALSLCAVAAWACSGWTWVPPGQGALLLRLGRLQPAQNGDLHPPGLLTAFPYPIDVVQLVPQFREQSFVLEEFWQPAVGATRETLDPLTAGYALTSDQQIVQARLGVKYRLTDPAAWQLQSVDSADLLRNAVRSAWTQTLATWTLREALALQRASLADGQPALAEEVRRAAQQQIDALKLGATISLVEIQEVHPPREVLPAFREVVSARVAGETLRREALAEAARAVLQAESRRLHLESQARIAGGARLAQTTAATARFTALASEHARNPAVVELRLRLETRAAILQQAGEIRYIPPGVQLRFGNFLMRPSEEQKP